MRRHVETTATVTPAKRRPGVCFDCLWVCSLHRDHCDHPSVATQGQGWRTFCSKARLRGGPCGPEANHWEPRT